MHKIHTHTPHKTYTKARMKLTIGPPKISKNTGGFRQLVAPKVWSACTQTATHNGQHGTQGIPKCHPKGVYTFFKVTLFVS